MKEILVGIKFNRDITAKEAEQFIDLLDEDLGHTLNKQRESWEPKNLNQGWGIGMSLVTDVEFKGAVE